jgi:phosphoribosylformylglycinamidine synthase II
MNCEIKLLGLSEKELLVLSKKMLLSLNEREMKAIQKHYEGLKRNPSQIELECLAQTWSEHCKHKVFNGEIEYTENGKVRVIKNLFKNTIRKATEEVGKKKEGFLVSVFSDNAGIIKFNDSHGVAFKVETHNHPSALDPYGGANTGVGGVVRDILGCGLGAKPVACTDVFCFADPRTKNVPKGILHPKRIFKGVRAGVKDYGNRLGIPTVNGSIFFHENYLGNPLVFCGTVGVIPLGMEKKSAKKGDKIVVIGGRTGRDGVHGATFSSAELDEDSDVAAVQIGNAIEEKKVLDVLLQARDKGLYNSVTDCGAGGFSSAVGEMGKELGAKVYLDRVLLKQDGLLPWEIFLSESQERMVLSVPEKNLEEFLGLCSFEDVEVFVLGEFSGSKKLEIFHGKELVGELCMNFLHEGVPVFEGKAVWEPVKEEIVFFEEPPNYESVLFSLLAHPNIASKEKTVRLYDHEVQGGTIGKPFVGVENDGPADGAVVKPFFEEKEGIVISNGLNPFFGEIDSYWMACCAIDEAIRNALAVGADFERIALLDNFCLGNPTDPQKLGELVRAANGCRDSAIAFQTPFISGKDSFYNEFQLESGTISVPSTLLISAIGVLSDAEKKVSMDFKKSGNLVYIVGETFNELGASHYFKVINQAGGFVPRVRFEKAKKIFERISGATKKGLCRAVHDLSEGGLAVALSEMAFASSFGVEIDLKKVPFGEKIMRNDFVLFSESNSRFLVEVEPEKEEEFKKTMQSVAYKKIGEVTKKQNVIIMGLDGKKIVDASCTELKSAWKKTLNW